MHCYTIHIHVPSRMLRHGLYICIMYIIKYVLLYIYVLFLLHTITCNPIIIQLKPTVTSTNETSISICTYLGAIISSVTTLINIWMKQISICVKLCSYKHEWTSVHVHIPLHVIPSVSSRYPVLHPQVKLPIVFVHVWVQTPSSHSSISRWLELYVL